MTTFSKVLACPGGVVIFFWRSSAWLGALLRRLRNSSDLVGYDVERVSSKPKRRRSRGFLAEEFGAPFTGFLESFVVLLLFTIAIVTTGVSVA